MSWLAPLLAAVRALIDFLAARQLEDARETAKADGAARAEAETLSTIGGIADAQARNDARERDARSIAGRLRDGA